MSDEMWQLALDDAVIALKECDYDFDKARDFNEAILMVGEENGVDNFDSVATANEILGVLETWLARCDKAYKE